MAQEEGSTRSRFIIFSVIIVELTCTHSLVDRASVCGIEGRVFESHWVHKVSAFRREKVPWGTFFAKIINWYALKKLCFFKLFF